MRTFVVALLALMFALPVRAEVARQDLGIVAVVGDDAITSYDVANRIRFIIATTKFSDTPDVVQRMRPQVVRMLIDERLQMQEAAKNDITVSDQEVAEAIAHIEQERGMPKGAIYHMLDEHNIPQETFNRQIQAQIAWTQLLRKKVRPQVHVSDEEIQMMSKRPLPLPSLAPAASAATPPSAKEQLQIAVITLPVEKKNRENEVRRLGEKMASELRRGASFDEVSRQFSSTAAASGGKTDPFWVKLNQLDPAVAHAVAGAKAGSITSPIRTSGGYTIVKVFNVKGGEAAAKAAPEPAPAPEPQTEVNLKEILLKLKPDANNKEANVLLQIGEEVAKHPGTCEEKGVANIDDLDDFDIDVQYHRSLLSELPPAVKIIADNLKVGDISTPFASDEGIRLYMLCDRKEVTSITPDRERVYAMLIQQKMELEAQKYMRNLRRETYIEVRPSL